MTQSFLTLKGQDIARVRSVMPFVYTGVVLPSLQHVLIAPEANGRSVAVASDGHAMASIALDASVDHEVIIKPWLLSRVLKDSGVSPATGRITIGATREGVQVCRGQGRKGDVTLDAVRCYAALGRGQKSKFKDALSITRYKPTWRTTRDECERAATQAFDMAGSDFRRLVNAVAAARPTLQNRSTWPEDPDMPRVVRARSKAADVFNQSIVLHIQAERLLATHWTATACWCSEHGDRPEDWQSTRPIATAGDLGRVRHVALHRQFLHRLESATRSAGSGRVYWRLPSSPMQCIALRSDHGPSIIQMPRFFHPETVPMDRSRAAFGVRELERHQSLDLGRSGGRAR